LAVVSEHAHIRVSSSVFDSFVEPCKKYRLTNWDQGLKEDNHLIGGSRSDRKYHKE